MFRQGAFSVYLPNDFTRRDFSVVIGKHSL